MAYLIESQYDYEHSESALTALADLENQAVALMNKAVTLGSIGAVHAERGSLPRELHRMARTTAEEIDALLAPLRRGIAEQRARVEAARADFETVGLVGADAVAEAG